MVVQYPIPQRPGKLSPFAPSNSTNIDSTNKNYKDSLPPPTTDRIDRTSFSSIKESNAGGVQTFTDTKTSSYLRHEYSLNDEDAIEDESGSTTPVRDEVEMLNTQSTLHGLVCPCDGFKGWKSISVRGRIASKSFGDLSKLKMGWDWDARASSKKEKLELGAIAEKIKVDAGRCPAGQSPIERLPAEIIGTIIDLLATDIPPNGFTARNIDLMSLLLSSRGLHAATLATLYARITIPHSRIFRKFLSHITLYPALGTIVRRVDFSHYNPTGGGQTARERLQTQNLIPETLLQCLDLTPNLREFLAQEHVDDELDVKVMQKLLYDMPKLRALDLCACSSTKFRDAVTTAVLGDGLPDVLPLTRLSLHEAAILPASILTTLLPRLPNLTHLDAAHTRITDAALQSIPRTAKLTHLNLSKCSSLSGASVVEFLANHPAARSLVYLNLAMDAKSAEMLSADDLTALINTLPATLRSLNLKGSKMDGAHINMLLPLSKHIEELGLGRHLELKDLLPLFTPNQDADLETQLAWEPHSLRYIDISDLSASQLDLGTLLGSSCPLLTSISEPLEVLEISEEVNKKLARSPGVKRMGWCIRELGRRNWLVRERKTATEVADSGERDWKMGASFWGMRKVPVARQEVGGMYGLYMFKR